MSPEMLTEIAATGKGKFVMGSQRFSDISQILNDLSGLQKKQFDEMVYTDYDDKFYYITSLTRMLSTHLFFNVLQQNFPPGGGLVELLLFLDHIQQLVLQEEL